MREGRRQWTHSLGGGTGNVGAHVARDVHELSVGGRGNRRGRSARARSARRECVEATGPLPPREGTPLVPSPPCPPPPKEQRIRGGMGLRTSQEPSSSPSLVLSRAHRAASIEATPCVPFPLRLDRRFRTPPVPPRHKAPCLSSSHISHRGRPPRHTRRAPVSPGALLGHDEAFLTW